MSSEKVWDREAIIHLLDHSDEAVKKALKVIYSRQTHAERSNRSVHENNGVGFSQYDAPLLSDIAGYFERTGNISQRQLSIVRKRIKRYWRQLLDEAEQKGAKVSYSMSKRKAESPVQMQTQVNDVIDPVQAEIIAELEAAGIQTSTSSAAHLGRVNVQDAAWA